MSAVAYGGTTKGYRYPLCSDLFISLAVLGVWLSDLGFKALGFEVRGFRVSGFGIGLRI